MWLLNYLSTFYELSPHFRCCWCYCIGCDSPHGCSDASSALCFHILCSSRLTLLGQLCRTIVFFFQTIPFSSLYFPETFQTTGQYVSSSKVLVSLFIVFHYIYMQLYYFGSFLSFFFPYDFCLGRQLSPLIAYFIRLIPALMAVLITIPLMLLIRYKCLYSRFLLILIIIALDQSLFRFRLIHFKWQ